MSGQDYGQARGSMSATGASGRDFANQAQGLGGLVRLYATYAANLFAVSAAFASLREAMNTSMMIRGLDQLGAASGVAMGGLAKQFAAASDGAISLREAMEATAKATTSGLSSKQFMELGQVAKGASQALGVNMSDAVSRLTRGITKLEPELLDELGIFTKVGKATEDYARKVGKSVDSLTDFEKRQAFANAVLAEGKQKFSEIAQESNPYDKLLASLKNVAQGILESINTVVGPIAKLFADSTALIGVAIAAAAVKITQQALPALTSWRNGMKLAAEEAAKRAQEINTSFGEAFVARAQQRARVPQLQDALKAAEEEFKQAKRQFVELDNIYKRPNDTLRALQKDRLLTERELSGIKSDVTKKTNENTSASLQHASSLVKIQMAQQKILDITNQLTVANDIVEEQSSKRSRRGSEEWQREQLVIDSRAKAAKLGLLSGVGERVEQKGLREGLGGFYSDTMANKDLGRVDKFKTVVTGTFAGIGTAAGILGKSLMGAFMYLEIALVAFAGLNSMFSKNGEAVDAFRSSMDGLSEATKTATNVSEKFGNTLTTESINAKANAFTNLTDSLSQVSKSLSVADLLASGWDKFLDGFKTVIGTDLRSTFSKGFVEAISSGIQLAPEGEIKQNLEAKLKGLLGTKDLGLEGIAKAVSKVPSKDLVQTARNVTDILQESRKILSNSQALTQDVKETGKAAETAFLSFSTSVFGSSPLQAFLLATTKNVYSLKNAFKDSTASAAEFKNIISGTTKLEFLPEEQATQLQSLANNYTSMQYGLKAQINDLDKTRDKINEITSKLQNTTFMSTGTSSALVAERAALQQQLPKLQLDIRQTESSLKEIAAQAGKVLGEAAEKQVELVFSQTKLRLAQLDIGYKQQVMQGLPVKTEASIAETTKLAKDAINTEFALKQSNENLVNSIDLLRIQMELRAAQEKVSTARAESNPNVRAALLAEATAEEARITNKLTALKSGNISELQKYVKEDPAALKAIMNLENSRIANQDKLNKLKLASMNGELELLALRADKEKESITNDITRLNNEQSRFDLLKDGTSEAQKAEKAAQTAAEIALKNARLAQIPLELQAKQTDIRSKYGLPAEVGYQTQERLAGQMGQAGAAAGAAGTISSTTANTKAQVAAYKELADIASKTYEIESLALSDSLENQKASIAAERELLNLAATTGALTEQQVAAKTRALAIQDAEIERAQKLIDLEKSRTSELISWTAKLVEFGATPEILKERDAILARDQANTSAAERDYQNKLRSANITESLSSRQVKYEQVFKNSFENMADAMLEFAKTGKFSFSDLANSMIAEIARIELRMATSNIWAALRPGIGDFLTKAITGVSATTMTGSESSAEFLAASGFAKGGAFDHTLQAFAQGGTFTNGIVNSPTLFKFAKGTGLMGEAGPEAIMPLTRDSQGNLGVRAGGNSGGNTEVVINNYSTVQADAKETTDSRGNRKIEVTIGDMTAGEIARSGSSSQKAVGSTFGLKPQLIRR
jgi:phage-related minor tail protein